MKKIFAVFILSLTCLFAQAVQLKLNWCPVTDPGVAGYRLSYSATNKISGWTPSTYNSTNCPVVLLTTGTNWNRAYSTNFNVGLVTSYTLSNAVVGKTYYIAVTAYDTNGIASPFSNEAEITVTNFPPSSPQNLQVISEP